MPLAEPAPEGTKFFCPMCGALYSVTRTQVSKKEVGAVKCVVCSRIMDHSKSTEALSTRSFTGLKMPEEVCFCGG